MSKLADWASVISLVVTVVILFVKDTTKAWIALGIFILAVLILSWRVWTVVSRHLKLKYPRGYAPISTQMRYSTGDGRMIKYDLYKTVQVKSVLLTEMKHEYKWSGTQPPVATSQHQRILGTIAGENGSWDTLRLALEPPLKYNDTEVVHVNMTLNDSDQQSQTQVEHRVDEPVQLISWRIELLNKATSEPAKLTRRLIHQGNRPEAVPETICDVHFDPATRSYETAVRKPTPGYAYRLSWTR